MSSLTRHSLHLLFCSILSILALIWLFLMALFCAAIRRDSVSLLKFPFLSHVQVLSCEMFIRRFKRPYCCFPSHFCFLVIFILLSFSVSWWLFHRSLSDIKSPQVSRTLLSILADLNNTVVWTFSGISTRTMHQSTTPFLSQTIWPRWASRQFVTFPIVQNLLPVTFGYSLWGCRYETIEEMKEAVTLTLTLTRSHNRTSMGPSRSYWNCTTSAFLPEEITSKETRVSCVYYQ